MKNQKNNLRTCIITRKKKNQFELVRLIKVDDSIIIARNYEHSGRGYYVSKDLLDDSTNIKKIEKRLRGKFKDSQYS